MRKNYKYRTGTKKIFEESRTRICDAVKAASSAHLKNIRPIRKVRKACDVDSDDTNFATILHRQSVPDL